MVVGGFICVKNFIVCTELCVDDDFEMIAVKVKEIDPKYTWAIIGIHRAPHWAMLAIERVAARNLTTRNLTKQNIIDCGLNLSKADERGDEENASELQTLVNSLFWGYCLYLGSKLPHKRRCDVG